MKNHLDLDKNLTTIFKDMVVQNVQENYVLKHNVCHWKNL